MPKLERLELNDNSIEKGLEVIAKCYPNLKTLKISNNKIKDLDEVKKLADCKSLESMDMTDCPLTKAPTDEATIDSGESKGKQDYMLKVREAIPQLQILDGFNKEGDEVESDEDESEPDEDELDDDVGEEGEEDVEDNYGEEAEEEGNEATKATGDQPSEAEEQPSKRQKVAENTENAEEEKNPAEA